jgi:RNA polymerase sigma factor (sigma-70 family)
MSLSDQRLLRDYIEHRSEAAFAELVRRHVDLVYSAAVRMVCDAHLAQDVTQAVFVALARTARQLTDRPVLSGWLHRTARNIAAETVRTDVRRRAREQKAAAMSDLLAAEPNALWEHIAPHLDTALGELSAPDRDALLLRYFEGKSAREMGLTLGVSEEAAQKRVSRAVERLRELFARRGVSVGAGGLVVALTAHAIQAAPAGLAAGISAAALSATAGGSGATVGFLKAITMTKLQTATFGVIIVALLVTPLVVQRQARLRRENESLRGQVAQLEADKQDLSNQLVQLKDAPGAPLTRPGVAASPTKPPEELPPFQQVTNFIQAHHNVPREQIEAYLQKNHRNTESLLAAFQISRDLAYLREAATNAPTDPAIQCAVLAHNLFPDEQRKWIDAFKASSPANALPWYFSALDYFKSKQPDQAIQELTQATRRQFYADYGAQTCQAVEEMYESAGWPSLAAKASAPGTATTGTGPVATMLKSLANETLQIQQRDFNQGDTASANSLASLGMVLGDQLRRAGSPIHQLVGIGIEKRILAQLDPAATYDFLGRPVSQVQSELDQQKQDIREALELRDQVRPALNESELNNYWEREKLYGEMYAMQWLQSKHRQP